jgi:O-acetyl-ADP-ribose deacetylase (regulator of RNase III)
MITELRADLFSQHNYSLAHCVSKDLKMGAGIAVKFRELFGNVDNLKAQCKDVGQVAELQIHGQPRHIFYLITKSVYYGKPTYEDLRKCLISLKARCQLLNITKLAIPRIGCGLDKLKWDVVRQMLNDVFIGSAIDILVCYV